MKIFYPFVWLTAMSLRIFPAIIQFFMEALWKPKALPSYPNGSVARNGTSSILPISGGIPVEKPEPWMDT